jgi:hypothetical protein
MRFLPLLCLLHVRSVRRSLIVSPQLHSVSSTSQQAVHYTVFSSRLVGRAVSHRPGPAVIPDQICVGQSGTGWGVPRCAPSLSCQCHSTNAPNSTIYLLPTPRLRQTTHFKKYRRLWHVRSVCPDAFCSARVTGRCVCVCVCACDLCTVHWKTTLYLGLYRFSFTSHRAQLVSVIKTNQLMLYREMSVPRSKHPPPLLYKPVS